MILIELQEKCFSCDFFKDINQIAELVQILIFGCFFFDFVPSIILTRESYFVLEEA